MINLNSPKFNISEYVDRKVVKVVIVKDRQILLFDNLLVGGGVEGNETDDEAITREVMEEVGGVVKNPRFLETVVQYRDHLKKRYVINGYVATFVSQTIPTTTQKDELDKSTRWLAIDQAIMLMKENERKIISAGVTALPGDAYQMRLFHT